MRLVAQAPNMRDFTVNNGKVIRPQRDGKFHVNDSLGKALVKSGEFTVSGVTFEGAKGYRCQDCGRVNVFRDHCGKCGGTNLEPED